MGRIKTDLIKSKTQDVMEIYGDQFTDNFSENKKILDKVTTIPSKKLRNILAGSITKRVKKTDL
jgi:small subunit ribosomal protein S17e